MEQTRKHLIYRILGTVAVALWGIAPGVLMTLAMGDLNRLYQALIGLATVVICGGALFMIWRPRKNHA